MRVAVIGSRDLIVGNLGDYLPRETTEIVSGGARGLDTSAKEYANTNGIKLTEFLPEYDKYEKFAPLKRNMQIIEYADLVLAFWDGKSRDTKHVIDNCQRLGARVSIHLREKDRILFRRSSKIKTTYR